MFYPIYLVTFHQILADWEDEVEKANQEIATKTAEADNQSQRYTRADQASESANKEVEECQAEIEPAEQDLEEHKSKLQEGKTALIQAKVRCTMSEKGTIY